MAGNMRKPPAGPKGDSPKSTVGPETKADMAGAMHGQPTDKNPLHGAIKELGAQHPQSYDDHGPHHGTSDHVRHEKLGGLRPRHNGDDY